MRRQWRSEPVLVAWVLEDAEINTLLVRLNAP
jgi:hypothetical protein